MNYVLMVLTVVISGAQSIFRKQFNLKNDGITSAPYVFNFTASLAALAFLACFGFIGSGGFEHHLPTVGYAAGFGVLSSIAMLTVLYAFMYGSLSLTSLLLSYSTIMPVLYGIAFLGEAFTWKTGVGLALLVVSLYLFNIKKENFNITKKWLFFMIVLFLSNGTCAILMKVHQYHFPDQYQLEFQGISYMIIALINAVILIGFAFSKMRGGMKKAFVSSTYLATPFGIANVGANLLTMVLAAVLPAVILFPVVSGGGIVTAYLIGRFLYKEKMSMVQNIAFLISIVSIVVLNL